MHVLLMTTGFWSMVVSVCNVVLDVEGDFASPGQPLIDFPLIRYSFHQMVSDFWTSGAWLISSLLVIGSAILPQFKGMLMLYLWFRPMHWDTRGKVLLVQDILGKVAFTNVCFIAMVILVLKTHSELNGLTLDITAEPQIGICTCCIATLGMMFSSSITIHLHNRMHHNSPGDYDPGELFQHHHGGAWWQKPLKATDPGRRPHVIAAVLIVLCIVTYTMAFVGDIVVFKLDGLLGEVAGTPLTTTGNRKALSMAGIVTELPSSTDNVAMAWLIALTYMFVVIVMPICFLLASIAVWVEVTRRPFETPVPLWGVRLRQMGPYLFSYCSQDVLWTSVFSGVLEMNMPVSWIIQNYVGAQCDQLEKVVGQPCLQVDGNFGKASWWLLASAFFFSALSIWTTKWLGIAVLDHEAIL